MRKNYK